MTKAKAKKVSPSPKSVPVKKSEIVSAPPVQASAPPVQASAPPVQASAPPVQASAPPLPTVSNAAESITPPSSNLAVSEITSPNSAPKTRLTGPVRDRDGFMYFTQQDMQLLELHTLKTKIAQMEVKEAALQLDKFTLEAQAKIRVSRDAIEKLEATYNSKVGEIETLHKEIAQVYKIDMRKISFDPSNGKIHFT